MPSPDLNLDDLDLRILDQLQRDCSLSNQALAQRVHASPPTCLRRVRRLVESGVIERQVAILNPAALGVGLTAIIEITLDTQAAEDLDAFEVRIVADPAIGQCYRVSSGPDFILVAQVADMDAYQALARRALTGDARVRNVRSFFATARGKFDTRYPISSNLGLSLGYTAGAARLLRRHPGAGIGPLRSIFGAYATRRFPMPPIIAS